MESGGKKEEGMRVEQEKTDGKERGERERRKGK